MKKKEYIEPEINIIDLRTQDLVLCGSAEDEPDVEFGSIIPTDINQQV